MIAYEAALLIWCEDNHPPLVVRITERRKDPAAHAKVGMAMVRLFNGVFEAERNPPESGWGHELLQTREGWLSREDSLIRKRILQR